jgi:hypothetical protein
LKGLSDDAVKLVQDLDRELRVDALGTDQVVQSISQRDAEAAAVKFGLASGSMCSITSADCVDGTSAMYLP